MKKSAVWCLALVCLVVAPVLAIQYGEPDGGAHPYVGMLVFYNASGAPMWRCSGTLLSPTVVLTAAHCTAGTASAQAWFEEDVRGTGYPFSGGTTGTPHAHPNWADFAEFPDTYDVGVVVLDSPIRMSTYGALPEVGAYDSLVSKKGQQEVVFDAVGYGLQSVKPALSANPVRMFGTVMMVNNHHANCGDQNLHFSSNPGEGQGKGGASFGDSGGPAFEKGSNVVAGIWSFVLNQNSKGSGFAFRTDTEITQEFVADFLD